jgi:hypothetical protein
VGLFLFLLGEWPVRIPASQPFLGEAEWHTQTVSWPLALLCSVVAGGMPLVRLRLLYQRKRVQAGYDLLEVVKVLARFTHLSVDMALLSAADKLSPDNTLLRPLHLLALSFAGYGSERELQQETQRFVAAIGTTFAVTWMSDVLYQHKEGGGELRASLLALCEAMEEQRVIVRESRRTVYDAIALGSYGNVLVFAVTSASMAYLLTWPVYLKLQLQTGIGLVFLCVIGISMAASFIISRLLSHPKLDYH